MIEPLRRGEPYPGLRPPIREQWSLVDPRLRTLLVGIPTLIVVVLLIVYPAAGLAIAVLALGSGTATAVYAKNRSDRHNAAVERGEIVVPADPGLRRVPLSGIDSPAVRQRLEELGYRLDTVKRIQRFEGGWLAEKGGRELAVVIGDDGGHAYYDPKWVPPLRAATEYLAGRGREDG